MKRSVRVAAILLLACAAWSAVVAQPALIALAQDDAAPTAAEDADSPADDAAAEKKPSVGLLILNSNMVGLLFYLVLGVFSVVTAAIAIERMVNLTRSKVIPPEFVQSLRELAARPGDASQDFLHLAEQSPSPIAEILKAGALRAGRPLPEVEKAMEDAAAREVAALRARHRGLSVAGNIAPLVGLHGTVVGMIFSFQEAGVQGLGKGEALAHGIYLALFTTAIGLTIAIPALLCANWFNGRVERYFRDIDREMQSLYPNFIRMERAAADGSPLKKPGGPSPSGSPWPREPSSALRSK